MCGMFTLRAGLAAAPLAHAHGDIRAAARHEYRVGGNEPMSCAHHHNITQEKETQVKPGSFPPTRYESQGLCNE